tara:strand:+ start:1019 stop:1936 length:918 start_codon:yes stop_codon:yes gene_type:complete
MSNARKLADNLPIEGSLSGRNKLINGAMEIFQRGTSFSSAGNAYNADRWFVDNNGGGGGRSTDVPDGFNYSLKIDPSSGGNAVPRQAIELSAAGEGGVFRSGQKFTLSFYLKSDNAGEAINIFVASGTTVNATTTGQVNDTSTGLTTATSWTRYTYTFTSNNVGGSDTCYNIVPYVSTPSGATYWTGFQLEIGSQASPFEHEPVGVTLSKCQRYYQEIYMFHDAGSSYLRETIPFKTNMRAAPTGTVFSQRPDGLGTNTAGKIYQGGGEHNASIDKITTSSARLFANSYSANADIYGRVTLDAEL